MIIVKLKNVDSVHNYQFVTVSHVSTESDGILWLQKYVIIACDVITLKAVVSTDNGSNAARKQTQPWTPSRKLANLSKSGALLDLQ